MTASRNQAGDRLLWLGAGVVVLMGLTWLVIESPWSTPAVEASTEAVAALPERVAPPPLQSEMATVASGTSASDPLRMARMALEAGMLIEPAEYSAWTLFDKVATAEPDNTDAREGLEQVAAALLQRGNTALEQGRYEDAGAIAATITARFPEDRAAQALAAEVEIALAPPPEPPPQAERAPEPVAAELPETDPIPEMHEAFRTAMAQNDVLRPAGSSAVDIVTEMLTTAPEHELTIAARDLLVTEMLDRSAQSIEARDTRAAQTWIDSAAPLAADPAQLARAQDRLTDYLIEAEIGRVLPASELTAIRMDPAEFPRTALNRGIEGWVELEFTVSTAGVPEDVTVIDASHDRYFREEAVAAVATWRFEPFVFMERPIPKRASARLAFVLN